MDPVFYYRSCIFERSLNICRGQIVLQITAYAYLFVFTIRMIEMAIKLNHFLCDHRSN